MSLRVSANDPRWRSGSARAGGGFTLVELLVVVAVIAVLISVLLPALGRARAGARCAECASGIRQLQLANDLYAQDHADRYMPGAARIETQNLERWHGRRASPGGSFLPAGAPITPYLEGVETGLRVRSCPEFTTTIEALERSGRGFERGCGGYGYNNAFVGTHRVASSFVAPRAWEVRTDMVGAARWMFRSPARAVAFADAALAAAELIEYSFVEPPRWPQSPEYRPDPSAHFRHQDARSSVAWLDGHVSAERRTYSESSGLYALDPGPLSIGWFGEASTNELFDYD